jgi:polyhydroxybutyrate depolymerase
VSARLVALAAAVTLVVAAAACGGSDDDSDGGAAGGGGGSAAADDVTAADGGAEGADDAEPVPSAGCEGPAAGPAQLVESTLTSDGVERRYLLSGPAWEEGDEPQPLVVDFHGLAEGADVHAGMTQLGPLGVTEGFVTVFPHGTGAPVAWNVSPDVEGNPDLRYVTAVLDAVEAARCIDTSRVYATGLSNGAMMTSTVACALSDRFAAVAPIAGITLPEGCEPSHPMPVLTVHGTADPILLFNGGINGEALDSALGGGGGDATTTTVAVDLDGEGYPATVRGWAELNGCEPEPTDEPVGEEVVRRTYDCPDEAPVVFYIVEGGGHSWPSSEFSAGIAQIVGPTTFDIDASREAWEFVSAFRLPGS